MKKKQFDCVEMKHRAQERIRRELANATPEEEQAYWQRIVEEDRRRREAKQPPVAKEPIVGQRR